MILFTQSKQACNIHTFSKIFLSFIVEHSDANNTEHKTQNHIWNYSDA